MPLVRTDKGLQWKSEDGKTAASTVPVFAPTPCTVPTPAPTLPISTSRNSVRSVLIGSKEFLPWILAGCQVVSWFGVKYLTSDRMQQQQIDDHAALTEVRTQLAELKVSESQLSGKLDVLLNLNYKSK